VARCPLQHEGGGDMSRRAVPEANTEMRSMEVA
jgi:hypothetical protein